MVTTLKTDRLVRTLCAACVVRVFRWAALAAVLVVADASSAGAQPGVRQVLVLQSFERGNMTIDYLSENLRVDVEQRTASPINVVQVVVNPSGRIGAPEAVIVDYIRSIYAGRAEPDLVVTFAGPASLFARKYRAQLFPDAPILFAAVDERWLREAPLGNNAAAVPVHADFAGTIDEILRLLPGTRQVFMVVGAGALAEFWKRQLEAEFTRFRDRVTFVWSGDLTFREILRRCATLPAHSAIFYLTFSADGEGGTYADERALADLHVAANAPIFAAQSVMIGTGIVGGTLISNETLRRTITEAVVRILNGASAESVTAPGQPMGPPIFDWRELQRWGIPESRLPPGSTVRFRAPSLWRDYRGAVLAALFALVVQSALIFGLLYERRARRRAELESRRHLSLAADASRRETMAALASSITHELGQPLGSILSNAHALELMVAANRATPETIAEILGDIRTQGASARQIIDRHRAMLRSREMARSPIDLRTVVDDSLALVAHDMSARHVQVSVNRSQAGCMVSGDPVLLQQVIVNLLMNATDAMADIPPFRRHLTVSCVASRADVVLSVRDSGSGLPADLDGTLFTPFVTTKSQGLGIGLTIARTIVDAHGGTIAARNNPEGGATFTVTLRRGNAAARTAAAGGAGR